MDSVVTDPAAITHLSRFALLQALKLEKIGLKRKGPSAQSLVKKLGFKGNIDSLIVQFSAFVEANRPVQN